jgi:hypothetical protein
LQDRIPNNIPLIILRTRIIVFFFAADFPPHPISRHGRHFSLIVSGNPACCVEGYLAVCNLKLAYRRAGTVMREVGGDPSTLCTCFPSPTPSPSPVRPKAVCLSYTTPTSRQRLLITAHALVLCALCSAARVLARCGAVIERERASKQAQG